MPGFLDQGVPMPDMIRNFGVGPASGMMAGQQATTAMDMMGRSSESQAMALDAQAQELADYKKSQALRDAERARKLQDEQDALELAPQKKASTKSKYEEDVSSNEGKVADEKIKRQRAVASAAEQYHNMLEDVRKTSGQEDIPPYVMANVRAEWKKAGHPDLPTDPVEAQNKLAMMAAWSAKDTARQAEERKFEQQRELKNIEGRTARDVADTRASATMYGIDNKALNIGGKPQNPAQYMVDLMKMDPATMSDRQRGNLEVLLGIEINKLRESTETKMRVLGITDTTGLSKLQELEAKMKELTAVKSEAPAAPKKEEPKAPSAGAKAAPTKPQSVLDTETKYKVKYEWDATKNGWVKSK